MKKFWDWIVTIYKGIEKSPIALGLLGGLLTAIVIGRRDAYFQRDEIFRPQRAALIEECNTLLEEIEQPLVKSTNGYIEYAIDIEDIFPSGRTETAPAMPPVNIPADKEEAVKWKIRKLQEPLLKKIKANDARRNRILNLIQSYTVNPQIEIEWRLVDTAINLLPGEDRFISRLWNEKIRLEKGIGSMIQWNTHIHNKDAQDANRRFIQNSPMAFRVYFYQDFIRKHMRQLLLQILREQAGNDSIIPEWLRLPSERPIPAISHGEIIGIIFKDHETLHKMYQDRVRSLQSPNLP